MIHLRNLSKTFYSQGQPLLALDSINLQVPAGCIYGVIGASGAGKSTLIRCVNLLERPSEGEVWVGGENLLRLSAQGLRRARANMGMIFQHFNLLATRTVYANIALPLELAGLPSDEIRQRVLPLLELTGLQARADYYPAQLSGGQKQRVAIARALASRPQVLLCDEATSALDPETTQSILRLLKEINQQMGITILLITHEMDVIKTLCDRVALLEHGRLVEEAAVQDFFARPQTEIGKRFVRNALERPLPTDLQQRLQQHGGPGLDPLVRLTYAGAQVESPLLSQVGKRFAVDMNVLTAQIELVQNQPLGFMLAQLQGDEAAQQAALAWLAEQQIQLEVVGYVQRQA
ncbi:methionine ABC transporter ATP-binding protein [Balneatrix alpica]|uniref:Methionine ABC transporter ATP-binding protein n=1 Tax=Balneatrix alpica TaxID=75684 RepID=A0ABV5ZIV4_9GAMM|nr:methionine ABC transporter ATP-binding protein [Balneatrix alpica]